ncbi:MAG: methyltransferase domain-containing protein [Rhodospirillales bacterium]|nr:methyltransferase domain-containing protein [Rhodospirillales bacterium]
MKSEQLKDHYSGDVALLYANVRSQGDKWKNEQKALQKCLKILPDSLNVLDVPVGTGRFFPFYKEHHHTVTGLDISPDMLAMARRHDDFSEEHMSLAEADITALPYDNDFFDVAVCMRFFNLVNADVCSQSLRELSRVSKRYAIIGFRHINKPSHFGVQAIKQHILRFVKSLKGKIVLHDIEVLNQALANAHFKIVQEEFIEKRADDTTYCVYLLEKYD